MSRWAGLYKGHSSIARTLWLTNSITLVTKSSPNSLYWFIHTGHFPASGWCWEGSCEELAARALTRKGRLWIYLLPVFTRLSLRCSVLLAAARQGDPSSHGTSPVWTPPLSLLFGVLENAGSKRYKSDKWKNPKCCLPGGLRNLWAAAEALELPCQKCWETRTLCFHARVVSLLVMKVKGFFWWFVFNWQT